MRPLTSVLPPPPPPHHHHHHPVCCTGFGYTTCLLVGGMLDQAPGVGSPEEENYGLYKLIFGAVGFPFGECMAAATGAHPGPRVRLCQVEGIRLAGSVLCDAQRRLGRTVAYL